MLKLLLDPLTNAQKAPLENYPMVEGTGADMRLLLPVGLGELEVTQEVPTELEWFSDGTPRIPAPVPRPLTWEITLSGAHARQIAVVLEVLWSALQLATFNGGNGTTRLWDYFYPTPPNDYRQHQVAVTAFEFPADAMLGKELRYLSGGSLILVEM